MWHPEREHYTTLRPRWQLFEAGNHKSLVIKRTFNLVSYKCLTVAIRSAEGVVSWVNICSTLPGNKCTINIIHELNKSNTVSRMKHDFVTNLEKKSTSIKRFSHPSGGSDIIRSNSEYDDPRALIRIGIWRWTACSPKR